jgi:Peptidase family M1 domain
VSATPGGTLIGKTRAFFGCVIYSLMLAAFPTTLPGSEPPPVQDDLLLMSQLNEAALDSTQIYRLRDVRINRDRIRLYFDDGFLGLFTPVRNEITGAFFSGDGEILLMPPDRVEKRSLAQFIGESILERRFSSALFRFTDSTAKELLAHAHKVRPDDPDQPPAGFGEPWKELLPKINPEYSFRIVEDMLGDRSMPLFSARIQQADGSVFDVSDDERAVEAVSLGAVHKVKEGIFPDLWCSFPSRTSRLREESLRIGPLKVLAYKLDTTIDQDNTLKGQAELSIESHSARDRVLPFELSRLLKVSSVVDEQGRSLPFLQNPELEESEVNVRGNDLVLVILPEAKPVGAKYNLTFTYQGNVISDAGNGVLYVGDRGIWYPNRGFAPDVYYDLTFHYPDTLTLVATGKRLSESAADGMKTSHWVSDPLFAVAGFNLGKYQEQDATVGNTRIEVYAFPGVEAPLEQKMEQVQTDTAIINLPKTGHGIPPVYVPPRPTDQLRPADLLAQVTQAAQDAVQRFTQLFGPFPFSRLAVSQIPGDFGQGWPELVYLPTLSFLSRYQRSDLGVARTYDELETETAIAHEIAHQWWGNEVGWATYRDQWLSEGFATYAAAIYLRGEKDGEKKFHELLQGHKRALLAKNKDGNTVESGGPIVLGGRLATSLNPHGYENIVYKKSCWVIHMLRMLLTDPATGSDRRFTSMLKDFVAGYRFRQPSTEDFIRHVDKYMPPAADLDHNHQLNWFFDEWVKGNGIPTYIINSTIRREEGSKYIVQGTIRQEDVDADFEMLVPVVARYGKDQKELGRVAVSSSGGKFRYIVSQKPTKVTIDDDDILAVVQD